jgi:isopenicillin-N epimerase
VAHRTFDRTPWLLEPGISFLNHGSFGACPAPVLEAQRAWRERMEAEPVRFLDRELEGHLDDVRREVAQFLNGDPDGIAFVPNATTGVSTVLSSLRFQAGDELLAGDHEYNATLNALRAAAARDGARVVIARIPFPIHDPAEAIDAYLDAVTPRTGWPWSARSPRRRHWCCRPRSWSGSWIAGVSPRWSTAHTRRA